MKIVTFTLVVRGSYKEGSWTSRLAKFGLMGINAATLMQELVASTGYFLNEREHDGMLT